VLVRVLYLTLLTVFVFANLCGLALSQPSCAGIHIEVLNIKNTTGTVGCALFDAPDGFPRDYMRFATRVVVMKIREGRARCDFEYIPQGRYAIAVIHDENMNGKHDTNKLGVPTEGFGFSNDPKGMGAPSFSASSFYYDGLNFDQTIKLRY
jgi:uncharacterized protein (DUF2141 family)